jgi:MarR family transcriptional regulator, lower aerobic nicotinate degradation pathway regulator
VPRTTIVCVTYYRKYDEGMANVAPLMEEKLGRGADDLGLVDALAQLSFLIQGTLAGHAAGNDLSMIQTRLLGVLRDREPTMQELARLLELDKSSVTGLVDRAERRRLVQRAPSSDDRRAVHVILTPLGRQSIAEVGAAFTADVASLTDSLPATEKKQLSVLATRIVNTSIARRGPGAPFND